MGCLSGLGVTPPLAPGHGGDVLLLASSSSQASLAPCRQRKHFGPHPRQVQTSPLTNSGGQTAMLFFCKLMKKTFKSLPPSS